MKINLILIILVIFFSSSMNGQFKVTDENYHYMINRYSEYHGKAIPNLQLVDVDGNVHNLHDFDSKLIILDFWATWCSPCIKGIPISNGIYERLKSNGYTDVELIFLSVDDDTTRWKDMVQTKEMAGFSLLAGSKNAREVFRVNGLPCYIVLDTDKRIIGHDIQKPNVNGGLMEFTLCQVYQGKSAGEAFKAAFELGDDKYYYPSQNYKDWDKTYINVYDIAE